jgi:hypothetical protein
MNVINRCGEIWEWTHDNAFQIILITEKFNEDVWKAYQLFSFKWGSPSNKIIYVDESVFLYQKSRLLQIL